MTAYDEDFRRNIARVVTCLFQAALEDWEQMFGFSAAVECVQVKYLGKPHRLPAHVFANAVLIRTRTGGAVQGPVYFSMPKSIVGSAVATAMMLPGGEDGIDPENAEQVDAVKELFNLFCGSATSGFDRSGNGHLGVSQSVEHLAIELRPQSFEPGEDPGRLFGIRVDLGHDGRSEPVWCLLAESVATAIRHPKRPDAASGRSG